MKILLSPNRLDCPLDESSDMTSTSENAIHNTNEHDASYLDKSQFKKDVMKILLSPNRLDRPLDESSDMTSTSENAIHDVMLSVKKEAISRPTSSSASSRKIEDSDDEVLIEKIVFPKTKHDDGLPLPPITAKAIHRESKDVHIQPEFSSADSSSDIIPCIVEKPNVTKEELSMTS